MYVPGYVCRQAGVQQCRQVCIYVRLYIGLFYLFKYADVQVGRCVSRQIPFGRYVCKQIIIQVCRYIYAGMYFSMYVGMYVGAYVDMYVCRYVGSYVCSYVCSYACRKVLGSYVCT